jgi:hypothetical protein
MLTERTENICKAADSAAFLVCNLSDCAARALPVASELVYLKLLNRATKMLGILNRLKDEALKAEGAK